MYVKKIGYIEKNNKNGIIKIEVFIMRSISEEFEKFARRHHISINEIYELAIIYSKKELNRLIEDYGIEGKTEDKRVSIADIIGYDYNFGGRSNNLVDNFESFFCQNGTTYQTRSIGMLEFSSDEVMERLSKSFSEEKICTLEVELNKMIINSNGLHRYHILRLHYLKEFVKVKGDKEKEEALRQKYKIPVRSTKIDLIKTYCRFLIDRASGFSDNIRIRNNYDQNYNLTGKSEVRENGRTIVLSDSELIGYTKSKIAKMDKGIKEWFNATVLYYYQEYYSFKEFIDTYFSRGLFFTNGEENYKRGK